MLHIANNITNFPAFFSNKQMFENDVTIRLKRLLIALYNVITIY